MTRPSYYDPFAAAGGNPAAVSTGTRAPAETRFSHLPDPMGGCRQTRRFLGYRDVRVYLAFSGEVGVAGVSGV